MKTHHRASIAGGCLRKLLLIAGVGLVAAYVLGVAAGYVWLHSVRHIARIGVSDVALFRVAAVRRGIAVEQFAQARKDWDAKNIQAAFLNFTSAVRNDPDNISGRLSAVTFLTGLGAINQAVAMLEEGLTRAPDDVRLLTQLFDLLTGAGRDEHALELLHGRLARGLSGPNGPLLQSYEVLATLNHDGGPAAKKLLDRYPDLPKFRRAMPVVARVRWESAERLAAINLLASYLAAEPGAYAPYAQLAGWQQAGGLSADAVRTAQRACAQFPAETAPRVLLIEMLAASGDARATASAVESYLADFSRQPEALVALAESAGRRGLVELASTLYAVGASRQPDLLVLALSYADALMRTARFAECRDVLAQLEAQAPESGTALMIPLRQRQVIVAAALNDPDNVREYARRLAAALRSNPEALEGARRNFQKMGIADAVTELSGRAPGARPPVRRP